VNNPAFLHEPIEERCIAQLDQFYQRYPHLIYWYDFKAIAGGYAVRVPKLILHPETLKEFTPNQQPFVRELVEPISAFVKACLTGGYLTRSQMYKYGNLFKEPTSPEAFQKEFGPLLEKLQDPNTVEGIMKTREKLAVRPWMYSNLLSDLADAPYITNLPLAFGFSLALDPREERFFRLLAPVLEQEQEGLGFSLQPSIWVSEIRCLELARISLSDLWEIKNCSEAENFLRLVRRFRIEGQVRGEEPITLEKLREAALKYQEALAPFITPVDQRPFAKVEVLNLVNPKGIRDLELASKLRIYSSKTAPIPPNYSLPKLLFPGIMPMQLVPRQVKTVSSQLSKADQELLQKSQQRAIIQKLEEVLAYSEPANKWVQVYFDRVRFPSGLEGRYNIVVENQGQPGVVILPLKMVGNEVRIGLICQYRYPVQQWEWEIPRGGAQPGLSPEESGLKELQEETEHTSDQELVRLNPNQATTLWHNTGITNMAIYYFAALNVRPLKEKDEQPEMEETEAIAGTSFFDVQTVWKMFEQGEIRDTFTILAVHLAEQKGLFKKQQ